MPSPLNRLCQCPLMGRTGASHATWDDLPSLGEKAAQQPFILIIDVTDLVFTKTADFATFLMVKFSHGLVPSSV